MVIPPSQQHYVPKGWGGETWIWNSDLYCGKLLHFIAGKRCSWHFHQIKDEVLYLQSGRVLLKYGTDDDINKAVEVALSPGDAFHVLTGLRHQMLALEDSVIVEFSTHHEDSDSIRITPGD
jgi:quercetin dioxygenase-like cupin family protein